MSIQKVNLLCLIHPLLWPLLRNILMYLENSVEDALVCYVQAKVRDDQDMGISAFLGLYSWKFT